jgi:hypothetical protein
MGHPALPEDRWAEVQHRLDAIGPSSSDLEAANQLFRRLIRAR